MSASTGEGGDAGAAREVVAQRHLRFGWCLVLVYMGLGAVLESLHGFKVGFYLDVSNETRRHMWTLAHTHGTLFGVINLVFCASLVRLTLEGSALRLVSFAMIAGAVLMPLGFLLGGVVVYGGDPGLPILLSPIGAAAILLSVALIAWNALQGGRAGGS